jgi:hypothetical protein
VTAAKALFIPRWRFPKFLFLGLQLLISAAAAARRSAGSRRTAFLGFVRDGKQQAPQFLNAVFAIPRLIAIALAGEYDVAFFRNP